MGRDKLFDVRVWTSYQSRDGKHRRAQAIMESFDHDALVQACKETRGNSNIGCVIEPHWSMGTRNLILEARFSDEVRWVLKIYMLDTDGSCSTSGGSASDQILDGDEIYETYQREFEAMEFIRIHTKLPVPVPHFIIRLPSSLGPTACLAMDLVQGVTGAYLFEPQHEKRGPKARNSIGVAQHRVLQSMADIQITLAQFQAPTSGHLRKFPYSEYECFMVDDFGSRSKADGFGVEGDPSYCTPLDFYTSMIAKRAQSLDTFGDLQYTTSAHKILNTIRENLSSCCNDNPCFYLTNVDLGARNAIFDIRGFLQAMIDVDTLRFVPIEYAVQVPSGLGIEFFPDSAASVWRADNGSPSSHMRDYRVSLFGAGARLGQCNLGASFALQLRKDSAALIQGFQVVDEEDTNYNDEWLRSESVLRLTDQKSLPDSSISQNDVQTSVAGTPNQSSEQSLDTVDANSSIQIHLPIEPDLQLSSHSKEIEIPGSYQAMPEGNLSRISQGASD